MNSPIRSLIAAVCCVGLASGSAFAAGTQPSAKKAAGSHKATTQTAVKKEDANAAARSARNMQAAQETPYHAALRQCVQQPDMRQRDRCIDDAIARYGRS